MFAKTTKGEIRFLFSFTVLLFISEKILHINKFNHSSISNKVMMQI